MVGASSGPVERIRTRRPPSTVRSTSVVMARVWQEQRWAGAKPARKVSSMRQDSTRNSTTERPATGVTEPTGWVGPLVVGRASPVSRSRR